MKTLNNFQKLGISIGASKQEIKTAYRKLAKKYHPDINNTPTAQKKFIEIKQAYNELLVGKTGVNLGLKTKYRYTQTAPTDPDEYAWWKKETIRRQREINEKEQNAPSMPPPPRPRTKKENQTINSFGTFVFLLVEIPIVLLIAIGLEIEFDFYMWSVSPVIYVGVFIGFLIYRKKYSRFIRKEIAYEKDQF